MKKPTSSYIYEHCFTSEGLCARFWALTTELVNLPSTHHHLISTALPFGMIDPWLHTNTICSTDGVTYGQSGPCYQLQDSLEQSSMRTTEATAQGGHSQSVQDMAHQPGLCIVM